MLLLLFLKRRWERKIKIWHLRVPVNFYCLFKKKNKPNNRKQRGSIIVPFSLETNKIKGIDGEVSVAIVVTLLAKPKVERAVVIPAVFIEKCLQSSDFESWELFLACCVLLHAPPCLTMIHASLQIKNDPQNFRFMRLAT